MMMNNFQAMANNFNQNMPNMPGMPFFGGPALGQQQSFNSWQKPESGPAPVASKKSSGGKPGTLSDGSLDALAEYFGVDASVVKLFKKMGDAEKAAKKESSHENNDIFDNGDL